MVTESLSKPEEVFDFAELPPLLEHENVNERIIKAIIMRGDKRFMAFTPSNNKINNINYCAI
ncbi:MAG: hypothetical protein JXA07_15880 [Spirochaetes bacterium]|nr:hypothetical protein [Spirochaetota bacterium]